ncbi:MAG: DUF2884 family protein, partial [Kangiellaceae bacterium]|nr:DUF2884 family protein [Kangiellaceae bacterium]
MSFRYFTALSASVLLSASLYAEISTCNYDFSYDIDINEKTVVISDDNKELLKIDQTNQLYLEGERQELNSKQQALVKDMGEQYRELLPTIANIAAEAAEIGIKAAALTLNALFVDDQAKADKLMVKLDGIGDKIRKNISNKHLNGKM